MINLLPTSYYDEIRQEENRKLISILGILFLLFLISLTLILFSIKIYIQGQFTSIKVLTELQEKSLKTAEIQNLEEKINYANKNILKLNSFYDGRCVSVISSSTCYKNENNTIGIMERIFKVLPSEIKLTSFYWQTGSGQISISGFSPNREVLFNLQKNLEGENQFIDKSTISFPPQNWIKSSNIDFSVSFKLLPQKTVK